MVDSPTLAALAKSSTHTVAYLWVTGLDDDDEEVQWGFTTNDSSVNVQVVSGVNSELEYRDYVAEGTLLSWDTVQDVAGLQTRGMSCKLSNLSPYVRDMILGGNIRNATVELHIGQKDPLTGLLVSTPFPEVVGIMDTAKMRDAPVGQEGDVTLRFVSDVADLSLVSSESKSHASQKLRSGDMFRQFSGTAGRILTSWGEAKR